MPEPKKVKTELKLLPAPLKKPEKENVNTGNKAVSIEKKTEEVKKGKPNLIKRIFDYSLSTKDFILSQSLLLLVGVILTLVFHFYLDQNVKPFDWIANGPITRVPISFSLELNSPEDETITFEKTALISGKTAPLASVIISTDKTYFGFEANSNGDFSKVVDLNPGLNQFKITSVDGRGDIKETLRTVYYSEEKI